MSVGRDMNTVSRGTRYPKRSTSTGGPGNTPARRMTCSRPLTRPCRGLTVTRGDPDDAEKSGFSDVTGSDSFNGCSGICGSGIREDNRMVAFWFSISRRFYFVRLSVLLGACLAASAQQDRILVPIDNSHRVKLQANQSLRAR